ncbi:heavy-metal-associated domain-containing protein [Streptococcus fryi]
MLKRYNVIGMKCQGCATTVTERLSKVMGVENVTVDLDKKQVAVTGKPFKFLLNASLKGTAFKLEEVTSD